MFADPLVPMEQKHYIHSNSINKYPIAQMSVAFKPVSRSLFLPLWSRQSIDMLAISFHMTRLMMMMISHTLMLMMMVSSFLPKPLAVPPFMPLTLKYTTSQPTILPHKPTSFMFCMVKSQQLPLDFLQQQQPNAPRRRHPRKSCMTSHSRFSNHKSTALIFQQQCASSNASSSILCNLTLNIAMAGESYQSLSTIA